MGFIGGTADRPLPIADSEAEAILNRVQEGVEKPRPKVLFEPGQMVRVTDGPFNDSMASSKRSTTRRAVCASRC